MSKRRFKINSVRASFFSSLLYRRTHTKKWRTSSLSWFTISSKLPFAVTALKTMKLTTKCWKRDLTSLAKRVVWLEQEALSINPSSPIFWGSTAQRSFLDVEQLPVRNNWWFHLFLARMWVSAMSHDPRQKSTRELVRQNFTHQTKAGFDISQKIINSLLPQSLKKIVWSFAENLITKVHFSEGSLFSSDECFLSIPEFVQFQLSHQKSCLHNPEVIQEWSGVVAVHSNWPKHHDSPLWKDAINPRI